MLPNRFYKHRAFIDVCFKVNRLVNVSDFGTRIEISWYLLKNKVPMGLSERVTITKDQYKNYRRI
jgi:hypothetical protein